MGSNYFGENNLKNERYGGSSSSSSSSRKGKKNRSNSSNKPKQPQRGLGVAQLEEKIRLDSQMEVAAFGGAYNNHIFPNHLIINNPPIYSLTSPNYLQEDIRVQRLCYSSSTSTIPSSTYYGIHGPQNIKMMGNGESERSYVSHDDSQPSHYTRWNFAGKTVSDAQQYHQQPMFITRQLFDLEADQEAAGKKKKKSRSNSDGLGSPTSGSNSNQELDLELRL